MQLTDIATPARGVFTLNIYRHGTLIDRYVNDNMIVNRGRTNVVHLLGSADADLRIAKIGFGTNGASASPGNTHLQGSYVKSLDDVSYPDSYSVLFEFSLGKEEANGLSIKEFGLLTASERLHARKTRNGELFKENDLSLSGTWKLMY